MKPVLCLGDICADLIIPYAAALKATYPDSGMLPGLGARVNREIAREVEKKTEGGKRAINDFVLPFYHGDDFSPGSTDVGDVSWLTPTAQFDAVCEPAGVPGHSWQIVSCGVSSMGDKGLLYAAKVLALAAIDLFQKPEILAAARAEFEERTKKGYTCPIEPGAVPLTVC